MATRMTHVGLATLVVLVACVDFVSAFTETDETIRVVVGFTDQYEQDQFEKTIPSTSSVLRSSQTGKDPHVVRYNRANAVALSLTPKEIESIKQQPGVQYVEPDTRVKLFSEEDVPYGITAVQGTEPLPPPKASIDSNEDCFSVCIVDSGLLLAHPDIPFDINSTNVAGKEFDLSEEYLWYSPSSSAGHGTHVAVSSRTSGLDEGKAITNFRSLDIINRALCWQQATTRLVSQVSFPTSPAFAS